MGPRHLARLDVDAVAVDEAPAGVDGALERFVRLLEGRERRARLRADVLLEGRVGDELPGLAALGRLVVRCLRDDSDVQPALLLLRNGAAVDARTSQGRTPLEWAIDYSRRLVPTLLRAGAALPAETDNAYIRKVIAAGGFRQYERNHLNALTATFTSKLGFPARPARRVVEYAFHAGDY